MNTRNEQFLRSCGTDILELWYRQKNITVIRLTVAKQLEFGETVISFLVI